MSVGRAFHRRGAAELKARSPTRRRVRGTHSSEFVAECRLVWRWLAAACQKCMPMQYCPMTGTLAAAHISWIRYVQQQEASVNRFNPSEQAPDQSNIHITRCHISSSLSVSCIFTVWCIRCTQMQTLLCHCQYLPSLLRSTSRLNIYLISQISYRITLILS